MPDSFAKQQKELEEAAKKAEEDFAKAEKKLRQQGQDPSTPSATPSASPKNK